MVGKGTKPIQKSFVRNEMLLGILSDGVISVVILFILNMLALRNIFYLGARWYQSNQGRHNFLRRQIALNASFVGICNRFIMSVSEKEGSLRILIQVLVE